MRGTTLDLLLRMRARRRHIQHIDAALRQQLRQPHRIRHRPRLLRAEPLDVLEPIRRRDAHEQRHVARNGRAHALDDLERQPRPVLEAPAVLVAAAVRHGRQELVQQVAVRAVDLDEVEARRDRAPRRARERRPDLRDVGLRHRPRRRVVLVVRERAGGFDALRPPALARRRHGRERQPRRDGAGLAPRVRELDADALVLRVREVGDALPRRDVRVVPQARAVRRDAAFGQDAGGLGDGEPGPARDDAAEVRVVPGGDVAVAGRVLAQRGEHDAVLDAHAADLEGLEELGDGLAVGLWVRGAAGGDFLVGGEVVDLRCVVLEM